MADVVVDQSIPQDGGALVDVVLSDSITIFASIPTLSSPIFAVD